MPTPEERLSLLEQTVAEYRPVLRDVVYELTIVKGLVTDQVRSSTGAGIMAVHNRSLLTAFLGCSKRLDGRRS
jgi:hypothetical protein